MNEVLSFIANFQSRTGRRLLVIGGRALEAHGIQRFTRDVDILLANDDMHEMNKILAESGFEQLGENDSFARYRHSSLLYEPLDVMKVDSGTMEKLWADSVPFVTEAAGLRAPSLRSLTALKLHAIRQDPLRTEKDLLDIVSFVKCCQPAISDAELSALAARYGPPGILEKLHQLLQP